MRKIPRSLGASGKKILLFLICQQKVRIDTTKMCTRIILPSTFTAFFYIYYFSQLLIRDWEFELLTFSPQAFLQNVFKRKQPILDSTLVGNAFYLCSASPRQNIDLKNLCKQPAKPILTRSVLINKDRVIIDSAGYFL